MAIEDPNDEELYILEANLATGETKFYEWHVEEPPQGEEPVIPPGNTTEAQVVESRAKKSLPAQGFKYKTIWIQLCISLSLFSLSLFIPSILLVMTTASCS